MQKQIITKLEYVIFIFNYLFLNLLTVLVVVNPRKVVYLNGNTIGLVLRILGI